jgi:hypothetical protein
MTIVNDELLLSLDEFLMKAGLKSTEAMPIARFSNVVSAYAHLYQRLYPYPSQEYDLTKVNEAGGIDKYREEEARRMVTWRVVFRKFAGEECWKMFNLVKGICFDKQYYNRFSQDDINELIELHFSHDDFSYFQFLLTNELTIDPKHIAQYFHVESPAMAYMRIVKDEPPLCLRHSPRVNFGKNFRYLETGNQPLANLENHWHNFVGSECPAWMKSEEKYQKMLNMNKAVLDQAEQVVMNGYVYLLQREANLGSNIYKIGKSIDFVNSRSKSAEYRNAKIFMFQMVPDMSQCEKDMKKAFNVKFPFVKEGYQHGSEDFMGNVREMMREFMGITAWYI